MESQKSLLNYLIKFITPERKTRIESVLENITNYITVVLEDIFQPHNASAVIRSCDCFGIQNLHIIENLHQFSVSKDVVKGSSKWVDLNNYNEKDKNTLEAIQKLKKDKIEHILGQ